MPALLSGGFLIYFAVNNLDIEPKEKISFSDSCSEMPGLWRAAVFRLPYVV